MYGNKQVIRNLAYLTYFCVFRQETMRFLMVCHFFAPNEAMVELCRGGPPFCQLFSITPTDRKYIFVYNCKMLMIKRRFVTGHGDTELFQGVVTTRVLISPNADNLFYVKYAGSGCPDLPSRGLMIKVTDNLKKIQIRPISYYSYFS